MESKKLRAVAEFVNDLDQLQSDYGIFLDGDKKSVMLIERTPSGSKRSLGYFWPNGKLPTDARTW